MLMIQTGRLVTGSKKEDRNVVKVIVAIQDANFVILQTPTSMERERSSIKRIKLLDIVIPIKEEMTPNEVQDVFDSEGAVMKYKESEDYIEWENTRKYIEANDFERFMIEKKESIVNELLKQKKVIN